MFFFLDGSFFPEVSVVSLPYPFSFIFLSSGGGGVWLAYRPVQAPDVGGRAAASLKVRPPEVDTLQLRRPDDRVEVSGC